MSTIQVNLMADSQGGSIAPISSVMRNRLINAGFTINQRGYVSGVALSSGSYGHDRFKAGASGCTYTFTQGSAGVPIVITITAGSLQQVIEGANMPEGGTYVLSWTGTAQAKFNGGSFGASPLAVTGIVAGANTTIEFGTGTCSFPQLEKGTLATGFEYRQFGQELALCQRYAITYGRESNASQIGGTGFAFSTTLGDAPVAFPVEMRTIPTLSYSGGANISDGAAATSVTALTVISSQSSTKILSLRFTVASGATTFRPYRIETAGNTAFALFSAEL